MRSTNNEFGTTTETQKANRETNSPDSEVPWADLELTVPNDREHTSIVVRQLDEGTLNEHEPVGAVFVSRHIWGTKRTQYIAVGDVGKRVQKRHFDDRLGSYETTLNHTAVRDELIARLSKSASTLSGETYTDAGDDREQFRIDPVHELRQHQQVVNQQMSASSSFVG